ncbi:DUF6283 family protein [Flagellatimonas centrodinii]|uniref:DUF6283 family protein n=1 Tax=Flagellatimonas centrodinii TaxID=2806210 RepID=UPI003F4F4D70
MSNESADGSWSLKRTVQCVKCPWRIATNPRDIPNGYCETRHRALASTIARPGEIRPSGPLVAMACHETDDAHCIGWLANQVGPGNNIGLRLHLTQCLNAREITLRGEQHESFEDTLPQ